MTLIRLIRTSWMDLAMAAAFLSVWLLRDILDYATLREWLWWPVVFEAFAILALLLAGMLESIRSDVLRNIWFALIATGYLSAAWLAGAIATMPYVWTIALWLLFARLKPPAGISMGGVIHRRWIQTGAGYSGLLWGFALVLAMLLMFVFSSEPVRDADGDLRSTSPAWIFPLVWTPYFVGEALLRARRSRGSSDESA